MCGEGGKQPLRGDPWDEQESSENGVKTILDRGKSACHVPKPEDIHKNSGSNIIHTKVSNTNFY